MDNEIILRDVEISDAEQLLKIYSYYIKNTVITFEYEIPSIDEFQNRIRNTKKKYPYICIEKNHEIIGYSYAGPLKSRAAYDWSCEMTVYLDHNLEKQGYGKYIYGEMEKRLKAMGITNLYACIGYPVVEDEYLTRNSAQFHEHLGYKEIGHFHKCGYKFGRWYDMIWMEKIIGEHQENQKPILNYNDLNSL